MQNNIKEIFVRENNIAEKYKIKPVIMDKYLINGRIEKFSGKFQEFCNDDKRKHS